MALNVSSDRIDRFDDILNRIAVLEGENTYRILPDIGTGTFECYPAENCSLYIGHFKTLQDFRFQRFPDPSNPWNYTISFKTFENQLDTHEWVNSTIKKASEGIMLNSSESTINSIWHKNTECKMVYLTFNLEWIKRLEKYLLFPELVRNLFEEYKNPMFHVPLTVDMKHNLRQVFHPSGEITKEFRASYLYNKTIELFIQAAGGTYLRVQNQAKKLSVHPDDLHTIEQVKIQLINSYQEPPTVADLVAQTGMSKSKLQRLFHAVYDTSIYQFIKNIRLENAMELLMQGLSVTEVGYDVGYSSIPNFSKAFKEQFQVLPGQVGAR
ncbi:AraC family transcriptional regulator [Draconibacterium sp. IB214405]|uniref:helix-turn-helix transcriptional regulator n=1 Tax=Draconibacterium sp. IB214405 TaxID=3097352 RepID=UPI002A0E0F9E|nr:AraC family transcriptional regulator [Draconibacterium sp. IB214405]MDX8340446.1 AraC family transcriptional regulator [Draconibacterium sp. IB214405]